MNSETTRVPINYVVVEPTTFRTLNALHINALRNRRHDLILLKGPRIRTGPFIFVVGCSPLINQLTEAPFPNIIQTVEKAREEIRAASPDQDVVGFGFTYHPTLTLSDILKTFEVCYVAGQGFYVPGTNNEAVRLPYQETIVGARLSDLMSSFDPKLG